MFEDNERRLKEKLESVQQAGVYLYLEGKPATPETIARQCVCEDMLYMADYVLDNAGNLKELRYDRVTVWK